MYVSYGADHPAGRSLRLANPRFVAGSEIQAVISFDGKMTMDCLPPGAARDVRLCTKTNELRFAITRSNFDADLKFFTTGKGV